MSFTSGPFTPVSGTPFNVTNPAAGAGNLSSAAAVIVNLSSLELVIASGAGQTTGLVDPFTRDIVYLDSDAGQEITIEPLNIGFTGPIGVNPLIYVIWYLPSETLPVALPAPIVPYGNLQTVSLGIPLVPNLQVTFSASGTILDPLGAGGGNYYLFGADLTNGFTSTGAILSFVVNSNQVIGYLSAPHAPTATDIPIDHVNLDRYKNPGPVGVNYIYGSGTGGVLRYAIGP